MYVASDAECSISGNTKIENNTTGTTVWSTAPSGGGIAVIAKGVLNISENVSIQNNQAVKYGGGGHVRAAGFSMTGDADAIIEQIVSDLAEQIK